MCVAVSWFSLLLTFYRGSTVGYFGRYPTYPQKIGTTSSRYPTYLLPRTGRRAQRPTGRGLGQLDMHIWRVRASAAMLGMSIHIHGVSRWGTQFTYRSGCQSVWL